MAPKRKNPAPAPVDTRTPEEKARDERAATVNRLLGGTAILEAASEAKYEIARTLEFAERRATDATRDYGDLLAGWRMEVGGWRSEESLNERRERTAGRIHEFATLCRRSVQAADAASALGVDCGPLVRFSSGALPLATLPASVISRDDVLLIGFLLGYAHRTLDVGVSGV